MTKSPTPRLTLPRNTTMVNSGYLLVPQSHTESDEQKGSP